MQIQKSPLRERSLHGNLHSKHFSPSFEYSEVHTLNTMGQKGDFSCLVKRVAFKVLQKGRTEGFFKPVFGLNVVDKATHSLFRG